MRLSDVHLSLTWRFAIAALVTTAVLGYGLITLLNRVITDNALENAETDARDTLPRRVLSQLSPEDLTTPMTGQRLADFERFVQENVVSARTARIKIWNTEGRVIYADDPDQIGQFFPIDDEREAAFAGEVVSALSPASKADATSEAEYGDLLEVYTPIVFPGSQQVVGAFEIYQIYEPVAHQIAETQRYVTLGLGGGLAVLYLVLLGIVHGGTRTIAKQRRALERAVEREHRRAVTDPLTDLPNRTLLKDRLTVAIIQARRNKQMLAVMFLDLDRFKLVNDTAGHPEGDGLLKIVSGQLKQLVREGDTVARVGGDEFVLLLPAIARVGDAIEVAQRIRETLGQPQVLAGHEFHITPSIGITIFPTDGDDAEALLTNADIAMYHAKEQGRNNYQFYTPALNTSILERLALENDLRHGLERDEFVIYYQPQVNISTGQIVGMEALLRWQHPERGLVLPMKFISVAEETGLIVPLGDWVLRTACAQTKAWQDAGLSSLRVAVNLSARQFQQRNLAERVAQVLQETGLDPHCLQLEITEGVAMQDVDYAITMLRHLKELGVQIAIDDFGTGHSSLSYLQRLPIDVVKIDQSFVRDLTSDPKDAEIAATVIAMAHNLKLEVIAEGVETNEQLAFLKRRACDEMQGYLFSRPVSAEALEEILVQHNRSQAA